MGRWSDGRVGLMCSFFTRSSGPGRRTMPAGTRPRGDARANVHGVEFIQ